MTCGGWGPSRKLLPYVTAPWLPLCVCTCSKRLANITNNLRIYRYSAGECVWVWHANRATQLLRLLSKGKKPLLLLDLPIIRHVRCVCLCGLRIRDRCNLKWLWFASIWQRRRQPACSHLGFKSNFVGRKSQNNLVPHVLFRTLIALYGFAKTTTHIKISCVYNTLALEFHSLWIKTEKANSQSHLCV